MIKSIQYFSNLFNLQMIHKEKERSKRLFGETVFISQRMDWEKLSELTYEYQIDTNSVIVFEYSTGC